MDLRQLKTFIAVAETASLSKAADRLKLGQPALSRHIRLLETELGVSLFTRHGRGMEPTLAGRDLLERVKGLVSQLEKSVQAVTATAAIPSGHVALGVVPTVISSLASRLFRSVDQDFPTISLRIVEGFPSHLIDLLHRGDLDCAVLLGPGADLHLRTIDLIYEDYVLVGGSESELAADRPIGLEMLERVPLVLPGRSERHRNAISAAAQRAGVTPNVRYEVESFPLILDLVIHGLGYTIIPISAVCRQLASGQLRYSPFHPPGIKRQLLLAYPTGRPNSPAVSIVGELLCREIASILRAGLWSAFPGDEVRKFLVQAGSECGGKLAEEGHAVVQIM